MDLKSTSKGFTLIELIMVTIILGILAAVAIPRYASTVEAAEEAAEEAVISSIRAALETYAVEELMANGRRSWPANPWEALSTPPDGKTDDIDDADEDNEWTFNTTTSQITHQRANNDRYGWDYTQGTATGDDADVGSLGDREEI